MREDRAELWLPKPDKRLERAGAIMDEDIHLHEYPLVNFDILIGNEIIEEG